MHSYTLFAVLRIQTYVNVSLALRLSLIGHQIIHVDGSVDSERDISVINFELILSDLSQVERAIERALKTRGKVIYCMFQLLMPKCS